eukprot:TRINITY_DN3419_c0_g1_i7.p2 TRINITY_DN3419_c0_g1~~TRINITY_DN3419_c0_g1_i7.p2  ORF type:complete len:173 (-),score=76.64 TRINITY_DN3419_c0_g1_i7:2-520(-)
MMALVPGDLAPDFTLDSVMDGKVESISLSSMKDKYVVLVFCPVDFGYVTPTEFYSLEPHLETFSTINCELVAISTEHISSQIKYQATPRAEAGLNFMKIRLASDPTGDVAKKYGVYKQEENICFSSNFIIDPEGKIITMEKCDFPVGCSMGEQLKLVQAAQVIVVGDKAHRG